ncbi:N-acetylneuraminate synthase [Geomonas sp. Red875]|uniref:N-acetylneuraminate synthase n=2 Tax=Geomesophilobacter sediminis TaxID=2798584 RepID=A0A8J7JA74_9BACT|nr:N-acetylneuraminate synthase [Geomesophilobacter sediminis]
MKNRIYVIAEAGVNHNGSLDMGLELVDIAAEAGADAVKFQTFKTENEISRKAPKAGYQVETTGDQESQFEMVKKLELSEAAHRTLIEQSRKKGIQFLSTPFDLDSLHLLARTFDLPVLKIPSGEITNPLLLLAAARTQKPVILSTGMSTLAEIETALGVLAFGYLAEGKSPGLSAFKDAFCSAAGQRALKSKVTLLHCTTEYPAPFDEVNLRVMATMEAAFGLPVGYSDHTPGIAVPIAAAALGAVMVEKHFTLDRTLPGPDHRASLEPDELRAMVAGIRQVEQALGGRAKIPVPAEEKNAPIARKSLIAAVAISKGESFTERNLTAKRPGTGISPMRYWELLGTTAQQDYQEDEVIG